MLKHFWRMIKTKDDLRFYLQEDAKRNGMPKNWGGQFLNRFLPAENVCVFR